MIVHNCGNFTLVSSTHTHTHNSHTPAIPPSLLLFVLSMFSFFVKIMREYVKLAVDYDNYYTNSKTVLF